LSPLIGAFFLDDLDRRMTVTGLFYIRFMDDILVLAPTQWKLRRAIGTVNEILRSLGLEKHPDKTFIGRIGRGFDFLGYAFSRGALRVARQTSTITRHVCIGFISDGKRRPLGPFVWMFTWPAGCVGAGPGWVEY
jgi:hypothetical protein